MVPVHEAVAAALVDHGITTLFGLIGDANLFMVDRYARLDGTRYVAACNESGAVLMANGFASTTGDVGVATVTQGPGLTNATTALVEGVRNNLPVVLIAGDTPVEDKHHFHNIDQREVVSCTGAGFEQARSPRTVLDDLANALRRARGERRPIVLNLPADFQWHEIEFRRPLPDPPLRQRVAPDPEALDRAVGIIASARRPVVVAGLGAADPEARSAVARLAERIGAPLATTLKGTGLFRGDPFDLGVVGTLASPVCSEAIVECDCLVVFGAGLNRHTTAHGSLLDGKAVVHCDASDASLGRYYPVDAPVLGDAAVTADTIVAWLDEAGTEPTAFRSSELARRIAEQPHEAIDDRSSETDVDIRTALASIDAACPDDRIVVTDGGRFFHHAVTRVQAPDPRSLVLSVAFGSIGLGLGTAVGASIAAPERTTLLLTGDGGLMLGGLAEFTTAVREGAQLVVAVCNDGSYGAEHIQLTSRGLDPGLAGFDWPDLASVAVALGGRGVTVRCPDDLDAAGAAIRERCGPLLVDLQIDPAQVPNDATHALTAPVPPAR